jgi:hypothetical protein
MVKWNGDPIRKCLDMLNPNLTVEAKGELYIILTLLEAHEKAEAFAMSKGVDVPFSWPLSSIFGGRNRGERCMQEYPKCPHGYDIRVVRCSKCEIASHTCPHGVDWSVHYCVQCEGDPR